MLVKPIDIRRAAMDLLARREHGFDELIQKLSKRFRARTAVTQPSDCDAGVVQQQIPLLDAINGVLMQLKSEGLQSDVRMAQAFVRSRARRGQGPLKIKSELCAKRLDAEVIRQAIESDEVDWFKLAQTVAAKRYGHMGSVASFDFQIKARRNRFLQQRGFCFEHISALD